MAVLLWAVSAPADDGAAGVPAPGAGSDPAPPRADSATGPPADLAPGETWLGDVVLDAGTVVTPDSVLRDVRAVGRDVRAGPGGLLAGSLAVDATVPFDVVADQLGEGISVRAAGPSRATVVRTVRVAGREVRVVATGTVEVVSGRIVVEPRSIDVGGPGILSDATAAVVRELVTIEESVPGLPEGLVLQDVTVADDGFRARLEGEKVLLSE